MASPMNEHHTTHCPLCHHTVSQHGPNGCEAEDALEADGLCACRIYPELLGTGAVPDRDSLRRAVRLTTVGLIVVGLAVIVDAWIVYESGRTWLYVPLVLACMAWGVMLSANRQFVRDYRTRR